MAVLPLLMALALVTGAATPVRAAQEDVAMFYTALAPYGTWVDYGDYGPVWYPTGVAQDWRPYMNGRWVPTPEGWVFETEELWGWATYHYGNWFPTEEYGWVWVPGSTWYPSTVAWRANDDYIGWAPVPPPDYVPTPAFYPEGGFIPGTPVVDLITPPFWTFAAAPSFLLGFGHSFAPAFSFHRCGCLAPFNFVPFLFPITPFLTDCFFPFFAPRAFFFFGPPFPFVARVTNIHIDRLNIFLNNVNINRIRNVVPSQEILARHPFLRDAVPEAVREGRRFEVRRADFSQVQRQITRPDAVAPPRDVPRLKAEIPKAVIVPRKEAGPEALRGIKGMELPRSAVRETPQIREQMRQRQLEQRPKMEAPAPTREAPASRMEAPAPPRPPREAPQPEIIQGPRRPPERALPEQQRQIWTEQELRQQQLQQERLRQRQFQLQQEEQRRIQQHGFQEFQMRQQELMRQRQMEQMRRAPESRPAPPPRQEFRPAPAPRPESHPAPTPHAPHYRGE